MLVAVVSIEQGTSTTHHDVPIDTWFVGHPSCTICSATINSIERPKLSD